MNEPLVSVIVATYRRADDLHRALQSVAAQTYPHIEIVVVDDSAHVPDNARVTAIIERFRQETTIPVIHIINDANKGSAATRNRGIDAARGEYITFLDDDDVYLPEKIERQLRQMLSDGADYSLTDLALYNEQEKLTDKRLRRYIVSTEPHELMRYHLMYHMTGTDCLMFKKAYLDKIGGFPGIDVGDEFYLMCEAIRGGGVFSYLPACDVKAYVHTGENGGLSSGVKKIQGEKQLFDYKKQFFAALDKQTVRYIKMRHHAVLAFAYWRIDKKWDFIKDGAKAVFAAPLACFKMVISRNVGRW